MNTQEREYNREKTAQKRNESRRRKSPLPAFLCVLLAACLILLAVQMISTVKTNARMEDLLQDAEVTRARLRQMEEAQRETDEKLASLLPEDKELSPAETDPTDPIEPTDPAEPIEPTDPADPADSTEPTEPAEPTEPTEPTEPGADTPPDGGR